MKWILSPGRRAFVSIFMACLILLSDTSCQYFKVRSTVPEKSPYLKELSQLEKYFVVHDFAGNALVISDLELDSLHFSGTLKPLDKTVFYKPDRSTKYKNREKSIVHEAHVYLKEEAGSIAEGNFQTLTSNIKEIRILDKNSGKEIAVFVFSILGATGGLFLLILATKSSCPFVYASDGEAFIFQGEVFGGAFNPNTEREDYLPLPAGKTIGDTYQIRITNELKERQFTDFAHLLVVEHDSDATVLLDKNGFPHLIGKLEPPCASWSVEKDIPVEVFNKTDNESYLFNDESQAQNELVLKFQIPENASSGNLVLNTKNSFWLDIIYGRFTEKFGYFYSKWTEMQAKKSREDQMNEIGSQGFPLSIYQKKNGQWELVENIPTVGPVAARDFCIPLQFGEEPATEIEIKLVTGFLFWELDKAMMDFSKQQALRVERLKPTEVISSDGKDYLKILSEQDGVRMAQPNVGDVVEITYQLPPELASSKNKSVFLHTKGYYELIREFQGLPQFWELNKFKAPGYFMEYSRNEFLNDIGKRDAKWVNQ